jgi:hypothetical protein
MDPHNFSDEIDNEIKKKKEIKKIVHTQMHSAKNEGDKK